MKISNQKIRYVPCLRVPVRETRALACTTPRHPAARLQTPPPAPRNTVTNMCPEHRERTGTHLHHETTIGYHTSAAPLNPARGRRSTRGGRDSPFAPTRRSHWHPIAAGAPTSGLYGPTHLSLAVSLAVHLRLCPTARGVMATLRRRRRCWRPPCASPRAPASTAEQ